MRKSYRQLFSTRATPQSQRLPGSSQILNSAAGFSWPVDDWTRLDRFLILGSEGGSYYASERRLTVDNAEAVRRCLVTDGPRTVTRIVEISKSGRAAKNDPAIFALAMCAKLGDLPTRKQALAALPAVCRIGTHLLHFADYVEGFGGWGRGTRNAVASWYNRRTPADLAYQVVKYQRRDGWSNRDLLRLAHPKAPTSAHDQVYRWITRGELAADAGGDLTLIDGFQRALRATSSVEIVALIANYGLPREAIPTHWLAEPAVWEALLQRMPMTAMIRNLATMTRVGLIAPLAATTQVVVERLSDPARLHQARVHPIALLSALLTYRAGHGVRGKSIWSPVGPVIDALDAAFYRSFPAVEPVGARTLLALDVSSSMTHGTVSNVPGLTPRLASAAMALITAATEPRHGFVAFTGGDWSARRRGQTAGSLSELEISPRQRLDDVVSKVDSLPFGPTDCALPMVWATERKIDVDTFVIYTDSETWIGGVHPAQALDSYRRARGIAAKLVVVGMVANQFTIADPDDAGMLDVVGFDTATPPLINDFARA